MSDGLNARESVEALETFDASARNSRESVEVLWQLIATGLDGRLSIEILEATIQNVESWGFMPII